MIDSKKSLNEYIKRDALANGRKSCRPKLFGDEIWKFQLCLRKLEYYTNLSAIKQYFCILAKLYFGLKYHRYSIKLGFSIPLNVFDKGFSIAHYGTIVVSKNACVGENCRIHEGVTIGSTNGSTKAAKIGNNVFIASGAKIIGDISIADDVSIAANAVLTKSIDEKGTTWGGVPAKKISNNDSHANLCKQLFV